MDVITTHGSLARWASRIVLLASSNMVMVSLTHAQEASPAADAIGDEILVTAQKRSERMTDVPLSITAATGEQLGRQGVTDTSQLTKVVPGFTYQEGSYGTPVFTIRGVGFYDISMGAGPTVTTYVDQVPLPYSIMTRGATLDLERVEVLKGPQGTLFGQNSTGGAINYIAAKPTNALSAGASLSYGRFNAVEGEAFISGPITSTLRTRLAVRGEFADGWQKSITRPSDRLGKKEFYNGRLLLDWDPTDALSFELNISGWQDNSESQAAQLQEFAPSQPVNPATRFVYDGMAASPIRLSNARSADWTPGDYARNNSFYMVSLRGDWRIGADLDLASITAYSKLDADIPIDTDGTAFHNFQYDRQDGLLTSFSQELRLSGRVAGLKWMIGGNYQRDIANEFQILAGDATNGLVPTASGPMYQNRSGYTVNQQPTTKSVFASADYRLTDQIEVQASARYSAQKRAFNGCLSDVGPTANGASIAEVFSGLSTLLSGTPTVIAPGACVTLNDATFKPERVIGQLNQDNLSWRASLNWKPANNSLFYISAVKGYKAGTFSIVPGVVASEYEPVTQESVLSFEAGAKLTSSDNRLQVTSAVYHYDYKNKQLVGYAENFLFGNLPKLVSIPKSRVWGAELEVTARPVDELRLRGGVSYVDSRVKENPLPPAVPLDPYGNVVTFVGEAFPNTPKWQVTSDAEYGIAFGDGARAYVGGSLSYRSGSNAAFGENPNFKLPSYALIDVRAGVEGDKWGAQLWGRNITNKYYWVNVSHLIDSVARFAGTPASYGITLRYRY